MIIGITGGSGSGKTTLLKVIQDMGGTVLDCDEIYHVLLKTDKALLSSIEAHFPGTVVNGCLGRKKLGAIVFADENALLELNRITHSAVKQKVLSLLSGKPALAAIDAIGLFESGLAELCDITVAVTAPEQDRIARLMAREGIPAEYAAKRIAAQHPDGWFREQCDHVLENTGTQAQFREKCLAFLQGLGIMKA